MTKFACAQACVNEGADYVLVVGSKMYGDKVYKLQGDKELFAKLAGGKATLLRSGIR